MDKIELEILQRLQRTQEQITTEKLSQKLGQMQSKILEARYSMQKIFGTGKEKYL